MLELSHLQALASGARGVTPVSRKPVKTRFTVDERGYIESFFHSLSTRNLKSKRMRTLLALCKLLGKRLEASSWHRLEEANKVGSGLHFFVGKRTVESGNDWQLKCLGLAEVEPAVFIVGLNQIFYDHATAYWVDRVPQNDEIMRHLRFKEIPFGQALYLMDEKWREAYEAWLNNVIENRGVDEPQPGSVLFVTAAITRERGDAIELEWLVDGGVQTTIPVRVTLPRSEFVDCIECREYDETPHLFARSSWLTKVFGSIEPWEILADQDLIKSIEQGLAEAVAGNLMSHEDVWD